MGWGGRPPEVSLDDFIDLFNDTPHAGGGLSNYQKFRRWFDEEFITPDSGDPIVDYTFGDIALSALTEPRLQRIMFRTPFGPRLVRRWLRQLRLVFAAMPAGASTPADIQTAITTGVRNNTRIQFTHQQVPPRTGYNCLVNYGSTPITIHIQYE